MRPPPPSCGAVPATPVRPPSMASEPPDRRDVATARRIEVWECSSPKLSPSRIAPAAPMAYCPGRSE
eukprot:8284537-Heterocapsa_arctica.AAC.1